MTNDEFFANLPPLTDEEEVLLHEPLPLPPEDEYPSEAEQQEAREYERQVGADYDRSRGV
jgi:hypothetical protein